MTAHNGHLQALLQCRRWELDAAAVQLQRLQQQAQAAREQAERVALCRRDLLAAASQWDAVVAIDARQRRLRQLVELGAQVERLRVQASQTELKFAQAASECAHRQMQLQGLREHHERLLAAGRKDLLRRQDRDTDAAHLVRRATIHAAEGGWP